MLAASNVVTLTVLGKNQMTLQRAHLRRKLCGAGDSLQFPQTWTEKGARRACFKQRNNLPLVWSLGSKVWRTCTGFKHLSSFLGWRTDLMVIQMLGKRRRIQLYLQALGLEGFCHLKY